MNKQFIIDGETFLNKWLALEELEETTLYLSASNYLLSKVLLAQSLKFLNDYPDKKNEYLNLNKFIIDFLNHNQINNSFKDFLDSSEPFMQSIKLSNKNLYLVIFKGVQLKKQSGDKIHPTIEETVAFAEHKKQQNKTIPILTMNEDILKFCKTFNFDLDIIDAR